MNEQRKKLWENSEENMSQISGTVRTFHFITNSLFEVKLKLKSGGIIIIRNEKQEKQEKREQMIFFKLF